MSLRAPSALTIVKLGVALLGMFNLTLMLTPSPSPTRYLTSPRQIHITNHPERTLLQFDIPHMRTRTLIAEETAHYPIHGTLADLEWKALVPAENHGLVVMGPDARPYVMSMFHTLHCLDRIRKAIVRAPESPSSQYHLQHCFNYVRERILCGANTRLNPINHVLPTGEKASDGIGLRYTCRDWERVYEVHRANYALNQTIAFPAADRTAV